jgi:hypothetical protein
MRTKIYSPQPIFLEQAGILRRPRRAVEHQDTKFKEQFDYNTLFFDVIFNHYGNAAVMLGPELLNLSEGLAKSTIVAQPSGQQCLPRWREMDRHARVSVELPLNTSSLTLDGALGHLSMSPTRPDHAFFDGRRVLLTLSKNNDLSWIEDWIRYNRDTHGADAVLLYDNKSDRYSPADMVATLSNLKGIDRICIVEWPFKYGPQGGGEFGIWDSNYCQHGALEHARWMFLQRARSVLNSDIDELVVAAKQKSVFAAAESAPTGMVCFPGLWVYGFSDYEPKHRMQHTYGAFDHYLKPKATDQGGLRGGYLNTKWAVVPKRCRPNSQWATHKIIGWKGWYTRLSQTRDFIYRHYRQVNTNWNYDRAGLSTFDAALFAYDEQMVNNFGRVRWDE